MEGGASMEPAEHATPLRPPRNVGKEPPAAPPDPDRVSKAYAVYAMHGAGMTTGFVCFDAESFGISRGAIYNRQATVSEFARTLLSEEGTRVRDESGMAELPAGSEAWLSLAEAVRLGLAKRALTKEEIRKLPKDVKRKRTVERGELSATLTAKMHADLISDESVAAHVAYSIKGTPLHQCFEDGVPSIKWCRAFLKRHSIDLGKRAAAVSELAREKWCTSTNFERFYTISFETLEAEGIVRKNPLYDKDVPLRWGKNGSNEDDIRVQEYIIIDSERHRLASFDETLCSADMHESRCSSKSNSTWTDKSAGDEGVCIGSRTAERVSGFGGSIATGESLPPLFVYSTTPQPWWLQHSLFEVPNSTRLDDNGVPYQGRVASNKSGGATNDMTLEYYKTLFEPGCVFQHARNVTGQRVCIYADGHGSQITVCSHFHLAAKS
ncbi:hypothetical protein T484DRAFT_1756437 [Baffinella frigidus]|nr:hypothetical protein T484DRAFT_1756437 [Cryptophyta sp. CCMP2293]